MNEMVTSNQGFQETALTKRLTSQPMEDVLGVCQPVLDHGFVRFVDYMGGDESVVEAARMSYQRGTRSVSDNEGLIRYLLRHRHTTPFEMLDVKLHLKMPIFSARQWMRHRAASINEYSARYSLLSNEFYTPRPQDLALQSTLNKQGREGGVSPEAAARVLEMLKRDSAQAYAHYEEMALPEDEGGLGLARELARINLPVSVYTEFYWKINVHNLLHFLSLRDDPHAQYEIRVYAALIAGVVEQWLPMTYKAFKDYRRDAFSFSGPMLESLRSALSSVTDLDDYFKNLPPRERREVLAVLKRSS